MRKLAIQSLAISYVEFCDKTPFELSIELEGHRGRWEESWKHTRLIGTLLNNAHFTEKMSEREFMPLPSDSDLLAFQEFIDSAKFAKSFDLSI